MSFVVSARKYRPQTFDELIGQDHVATTLKNAIVHDKLAHAFLFSGPRGVGKTTSARILAKVLNCDNRQDQVNACNECSACKSFAENASFNIFELDAASNNSVDHIRSLNDQVRFQPQQGSYKIYIIDEVHMLSQAAFNAFLKTLEEPPPYAKFILATTEKHKIIPTILSRCQTFDFRRISVKDIVSQLRSIAEKESRNLDDRSLHLIARKADGAMRDALSIYDKVTSSISGEISYSQVAQDLYELDKDHYFKIVDQALKEDLSQMMVGLDEIIKSGFEIEQFSSGLMDHLRNLLFVQDDKMSGILEVSDDMAMRYANQSKLCSPSFLLTALNILDKLDMNLPRIQNKRLSMEIALSKIAYMNRAIDKKKTKVGLTTSDEKSEVKQSSEPLKPATIDKAIEVATSQPAARKADPVPEQIQQPKSEPNKGSSQKPTQAPKKAQVSSVKGNPTFLPKLEVDIDGLIQSIEEEENTKRGIKNPFEAAFIESIFDDWKTKTDSNSLKTTLNFIKVELKKGEITIITPLQLYAEMIRQESDLMQTIRDKYPLMDLKFEFKIDLEAFPEMEPPKQRRLLSFPEKYEKLKEKNPAFEELFRTLKLEPKK